MSASRSWLATLFAAALAGLLGGCASLQPIPDDERFYTLAPPEGVDMAPASGSGVRPSVGIHVDIHADYLREPAMVVRASRNEVRFERGHRWAGRLDDDLERALTAALQQDLGATSVAPVLSGARATVDVLIDIRLVACEGTTDGAAVLEAFWEVTTLATPGAGAAGHFRGQKDGWNGTDFGQLAAMLSTLVEELAGEIAPEAQAGSTAETGA